MCPLRCDRLGSLRWFTPSLFKGTELQRHFPCIVSTHGCRLFSTRLVLDGRGGCWVLPALRTCALFLMVTCFPPGYSCPRWPLFPLPLAVGTSAGPRAAFPMASSYPQCPCSAAELRRSWFTFHAEPTFGCGLRKYLHMPNCLASAPSCCFAIAVIISGVVVVVVVGFAASALFVFWRAPHFRSRCDED